MALLIFGNSGSVLGLNVVCIMLLVPKCRGHDQHFILHSWLSHFPLFWPQVLCCEFNRLVLKPIVHLFRMDGCSAITVCITGLNHKGVSVSTFQLPCVFRIFGLVISTPSAVGIFRDYIFSSLIQSLEVELPKSVP